MTAKLRWNEKNYSAYYDEIEVYEEGGHFKGAFQRRNRSMVDRSQLAIFCVEHPSGGAWQTMRYAQRKGVRLLNIAEKSSNALD